MFGDTDLAVHVESAKGNGSSDDTKTLEFDNILFRKDKAKSNGSGLAAVLDPSGLGNGANAMSNQTITAMRPPSEDAVGFELGWRPTPNIKDLPWTNKLLSHLR